MSKAIHAVGPEGMIEIEESASGVNSLELVEGIIFDRGWVSEDFLSEKKVREVEMQYPLILVVGDKISDPGQIVRVMDMIKPTNRPLLLFSEDL